MSSVRSQCLALLALLPLAACGGSATPASSPAASAAKAASGSGSPVLDALYQKAKSEGSITWYDATSADIMAPVIQEFEKAYPGVHVAYTDAKPPDIFTNVRLQETAHNVTIDVADAAELNIPDALNGGLPSTIDWAGLGISSDLILGQKLVQESSSVHVVIYNTGKVSAADAPKTWDDLLNPRWKGQIAVDGRATFMPQYFFDAQLGVDKGVAFAKQLATQQPLFEASNETIIPKVVSGQVAIGTTVLSQTLFAQKKGAPIEIAPVTPTNIAPTYLYVPVGAPHPSAAQLLVAWLGSPAAQQALNASYTTVLASSTNCPGNGTTLNEVLCSRHIEWYGPSSLEQLLALPDFYQKVEQALGTYTGK